MALINVRIEPKPERKRHEDKDVWSNSSDIAVWNMYDQDYDVIQAEGLGRLFDGQEDFVRRVRRR